MHQNKGGKVHLGSGISRFGGGRGQSSARQHFRPPSEMVASEIYKHQFDQVIIENTLHNHLVHNLSTVQYLCIDLFSCILFRTEGVAIQIADVWIQIHTSMTRANSREILSFFSPPAKLITSRSTIKQLYHPWPSPLKYTVINLEIQSSSVDLQPQVLYLLSFIKIIGLNKRNHSPCDVNSHVPSMYQNICTC